jgi:hypothetical protein
MPTWCRHLALRRLRNFCDDHACTRFFAWKCRLNRRMLRQRDDRLANLGSHRDRCMARRVFPRRRRRGTMVRCGVCCPRAQLPSTPVVEDSWESRVNGRSSFISANACDSRYSVGTIADLFSTSERRPGKTPSLGSARWLHPISKRRAKFSASHATLDPDRACSAAQVGTPSLSKAAIRLTQMMKAGDTLSLRPLRHVQSKCAGHHRERKP